MNFIVGAAMGGRLASFDAMALVFQASWVVQLVLLLLIILSVISWTIIAFKWRELRRAEQDSEAFLEVYHEGSLDAAYEAARDLDRSPLSAIFLEVYSEINRMATTQGAIDGIYGFDSKLHHGSLGCRHLVDLAPGVT